jgi:hypothetical protein
MEPGEWARKVLDIIESETHDLIHSGEPTPESEPDVEIAPLVQKIGATSIAEVEKMIGEFQAAKDFLESEGDRVQREAEHYTTRTQMASASVKIISDTVAGWREAGHLYETIRDPPNSISRYPSRGRQHARVGSASAAVPATDPSPDPWEAIPRNSIWRGTVVARAGQRRQLTVGMPLTASNRAFFSLVVDPPLCVTAPSVYG